MSKYSRILRHSGVRTSPYESGWTQVNPQQRCKYPRQTKKWWDSWCTQWECCDQQVFSKKQSCRMDSGALGRNHKVLDRTQQPYRAEEAGTGEKEGTGRCPVSANQGQLDWPLESMWETHQGFQEACGEIPVAGKDKSCQRKLCVNSILFVLTVWWKVYSKLCAFWKN